MKEIYILGIDEKIMLFQSIGIEAIVVEKVQDLRKKVDEISECAKIIFLSESLGEVATEIKIRYQEKTYPIIITLPLDHESVESGLEKLKKDVEKAIGISLF